VTIYSMRVLIRSVVIFLLPLLWCEAAKPTPVPAPAATPLPAQGLSAATRELFAWFDKLGFEDNTRAKLVAYRPSDTQKDVIREAFILEEDQESIRVQGADLSGALNKLRHDKFVFDRLASQAVRDRQRLKILNDQRRELGQAELPPPPARPKVPSAKKNHVVTLEWEERSVQPDEELRWSLRPLPREPFHSRWRGRSSLRSRLI